MSAQVDSSLKLNILSHLQDDKQALQIDNAQSLEPGVYKLENFYEKECRQPSAREIQTSQVGINFSGGEGSIGRDGCLVDDNSYLRFHELTNLNNIHQLNTRLTLTTPYVRGFYDVNNESYLISGDGTKRHRACNVLSGVSLLKDHIYTPQVKKLRENVQNPIHIIPENNMESWKRGGVSTRQIMRNMDYYNRCQLSNQTKKNVKN